MYEKVENILIIWKAYIVWKISNYLKFSDNLNFFNQFKCSHTFHTFQQTFTLFAFVYLCLPLFTFVYLYLPLFTFAYLCLPLFTFVQLTHLCTNFVLVYPPFDSKIVQTICRRAIWSYKSNRHDKVFFQHKVIPSPGARKPHNCHNAICI